MTAPLIGLIGKKRAGKDTFAAALIEEHGFRRFAFADPMKAGILELDPWVSVEEDEKGLLRPGIDLTTWEAMSLRLSYLVGVVGWETAKELREVRRLLQEYGNGLRNAAGLNVWVDGLMAQVAEARNPDPSPEGLLREIFAGPQGDPVVITDVRYPNEAEAVKAAGGLLVRITRPGRMHEDNHISETALDDWPVDATAINSQGIPYLRRQASCLVGGLLARR